MPVAPSDLLVPGPWTHRDVTAGGVRFHVAECGPQDGPLVLLLHGFPEFWWSWRHQLVALGEAGFRAVAPDLRGYGASDKPPRGYDAYTLSADLAGLVRALGAQDAALVGHDWGGILGWAAATLHPRLVRRLAVLAAPHPLRLAEALRSDPAQLRASSYIGFFQLPRAPEARLRGGAYVTELLTRWGGPGFPDAETDARCRAAMQVPAAAHCSLEWYRWAVRSLTRPSGWRYQRLLARGVQVPVLQLHGALDTCLLPSTAAGSDRYARAGHALQVWEGVGHFVQQEAPERTSAALVAFLRPDLPATTGTATTGTATTGTRRPLRGRDRLGRPVPLDDPERVPDVPEEPLPPAQALALAQALLDEDRCFNAHEVLEASWKAAPEAERTSWQGLAQVCVGATHLQRGKPVGAARLLRRGAGNLEPALEGVDVDAVRRWALRLAEEVEQGLVVPGSRDAPWTGSGGRLRLAAAPHRSA